MDISRSYFVGFKHVVKQHKMWLILYFVQFLFAGLILLPLRAQFEKLLSHRSIGEEIVNGLGAHFYIEFFNHFKQIISSEMTLLLVGGFIYLASTIFFNGGIYSILLRDEPFSAKEFFGNSGAYFGRFIRLFLISIPFFIAALIIDALLGSWFKWIGGDSEPTRVLLWIVGKVILLVLIGYISMVFDYAKIRTVFQERKDMWKTVFRAFGFTFQNFSKTVGLYLFLTVTALIIFLLYTLPGQLIAASTSIGIILFFLWQQLYAFCRIGIRMLFASAQIQLYREYTEPYLNAWFANDQV